MTRGVEVYSSQCATCHQADGAGLPPAFPSLAGSEVVNGSLDENIHLILNGVDGTAMQAWGNMLTPVDIAAVITFIRNSFGNETGDQVQPETVVLMQGDES